MRTHRIVLIVLALTVAAGGCTIRSKKPQIPEDHRAIIKRSQKKSAQYQDQLAEQNEILRKQLAQFKLQRDVYYERVEKNEVLAKKVTEITNALAATRAELDRKTKENSELSRQVNDRVAAIKALQARFPEVNKKYEVLVQAGKSDDLAKQMAQLKQQTAKLQADLAKATEAASKEQAVLRAKAAAEAKKRLADHQAKLAKAAADSKKAFDALVAKANAEEQKRQADRKAQLAKLAAEAVKQQAAHDAKLAQLAAEAKKKRAAREAELAKATDAARQASSVREAELLGQIKAAKDAAAAREAQLTQQIDAVRRKLLAREAEQGALNDLLAKADAEYKPQKAQYDRRIAQIDAVKKELVVSQKELDDANRILSDTKTRIKAAKSSLQVETTESMKLDRALKETLAEVRSKRAIVQVESAKLALHRARLENVLKMMESLPALEDQAKTLLAALTPKTSDAGSSAMPGATGASRAPVSSDSIVIK